MNQKIIYFVGFMGSGKTTLGKRLAKKLEIPFIDLDAKICEVTGKTIPEIFDKEGEESFRKIEQETLRNLSVKEAAVVSVGGGTPCFFDNMSWMNKHGLTVYLKLSPKAILRRLSSSNLSERPLLKNLTNTELLTFIEEKLKDREAYYLSAKYHFDPLNESIEELIQTYMNNIGH
jgi:shikimate kinase